MKNIILLVSTTFVLLASTVSYAKGDTDLRLKVAQCASIKSDNSRLQCFDKLMPATAKQPNTAMPVSVNKPDVEVVATAPLKVSTKAEQNKPINSNSVEKNQVDDFAKEHLKVDKEEGPSSITATVSKAKKLLKGKWVIYLENGQKWQQTDSAKMKLKAGSKVRLKKGALGAVYLYTGNSHRSIKVKRLK